jgi:hypothetical protein
MASRTSVTRAAAAAALLSLAACGRGGGAQKAGDAPRPVTLSPENVAVV